MRVLRTVKTRSENPYAHLGITPASTRKISYVLAPPPQFTRIAVARKQAKRILNRDFPSGVPPQIRPGFLVQVEFLAKGPPDPPDGAFALAWAFVIRAVVQKTFPPLDVPLRWTVIFIDARSGRDDGGFIG